MIIFTNKQTARLKVCCLSLVVLPTNVLI